MSEYEIKSKILGDDLPSRLHAAILMIRLLENERNIAVQAHAQLQEKYENLEDSFYMLDIGSSYTICDCGRISDSTVTCACEYKHMCMDCDDGDHWISCDKCDEYIGHYCDLAQCQELGKLAVCKKCK